MIPNRIFSRRFFRWQWLNLAAAALGALSLTPATAAENILANGDAESGEIPFAKTSNVAISLFNGDPTGGNAAGGSQCFQIKVPKAGKTNFSIGQQLFIDPSKKYRISADVYTPSEITIIPGGYALSDPGKPLEVDGKTWGYKLSAPEAKKPGAKGPLPEWTRLEATIHPAGGETSPKWPAEALRVSLTFWLQSEMEGELYLDNIKVEPLDE